MCVSVSLCVCVCLCVCVSECHISLGQLSADGHLGCFRALPVVNVAA